MPELNLGSVNNIVVSEPWLDSFRLGFCSSFWPKSWARLGSLNFQKRSFRANSQKGAYFETLKIYFLKYFTNFVNCCPIFLILVSKESL